MKLTVTSPLYTLCKACTEML